jgi:hypothetical protein
LFDLPSFVRVLAFSIIYGGIEYFYVNRREERWTHEMEGFFEKYLFWKITPYHFYFLLPLIIIVSYSPSVSAWAGNTFYAAILEDIAYFGWRGKMVMKGEWTTQLFGSFNIGRFTIPVWWPLELVVVWLFYAIPWF